MCTYFKVLQEHVPNIHTVFDRISARGAHLILGPRREALTRTRRSFERGALIKYFSKKRENNISQARIISFT